MTEQPILQIDKLDFAIGGHRILKDINCCFAGGGIHGLIGPNGSGKSTLLRNICRIWEPQSGRVLIDGRDYRRFPRKTLSQTVTLVQQDTRLDFSITVFDFVGIGNSRFIISPYLNGKEINFCTSIVVVESSCARHAGIFHLVAYDCASFSIVTNNTAG